MSKDKSGSFFDRGIEKLTPQDGVEDMTVIEDIDEDGINTNLETRFKRDEIYTYTGTILVAVNPFKYIPGIYEQEVVRQYTGVRMGAIAPHVFATAEATYENIRSTPGNQSVIISGESGAGKTENTKLILQYLTAVTQNPKWIEQQIMEANTILEAFGNAKTVRNNNSSRFGKFTKVCFNSDHGIKGCVIQDYLLEQSRVVGQAADERNYHVFYQLCAGCKASPDLANKFMVKEPKYYNYLNQSGCIAISGVDDKKEFDALRLAMTVLSIQTETQDSLFCILSAVLLLGNLEFKDVDGESIDLAPGDVELVDMIAKLLKVDSAGIKKALSFRQLTVRDNTTEIPLKIGEARENRNAMAKALYSRVFTVIIHHINNCTNPGSEPARFIGVLDIFGFENFKINSFEQLCINYTNEKLHKFFNDYCFSVEQAEYDAEGINYSHITFHDNQDALDAIDKPPNCILKFLDEECRFPKGTDKTYLEKQHKALDGIKNYIKPTDKRTVNELFGVQHFAGPVMYTITGFLDKNKDAQQDLLFDLMKASSDNFVKEVQKFRDISAGAGAEAAAAASKDSKGKGKPTIGSIFKEQLNTLVQVLGATTPFYVRCIKPNSEKVSGKFDKQMVMDQLRYSGMLDIIRIRKIGFPVKIKSGDFLQKYRCLAPKDLALGADEQAACKAIMMLLKLPTTEWQVGKTKLFFRQRVFDPLEDMRRKLLADMAGKIQSYWKMILQRRKYQRLRKAVIFTQRGFRRHMDRLRFKKKRRAIVVIQAYYRGMLARDLYRFMRKEKLEKERAEKEARESEEARAKAKLLGDMKEAAAIKESTEKRRASIMLEGTPEGERMKEEEKKSKEKKEEEAKQEKKNEDRAARRATRVFNKPVAAASKEEAMGDPTLRAYVEKYCNMHPKTNSSTFFRSRTAKSSGGTVTGTQSGTKVEMFTVEEMCLYQKASSIPTSFTILEDSNDVTLAISMFKELAKFYKCELKAGVAENQMIRHTIEWAIERQDLRDELFFQLFKQTNGNPKPERASRAWLFLSYVSCCFPPSNSLFKHLLAYLNDVCDGKIAATDDAKQRATFCRRMLRQVKGNGARKYAPSNIELVAIRTMVDPVVIVNMLDGSKEQVPVDPSLSTTDCVAMIAKRLGLESPEGWAIYEQSGTGIERAVRGVEYIMDVVTEWENAKRQSVLAAYGEGDTLQPIGGADDARLFFKKRLFKNPRELPADPVAYQLIYCQAVQSVIRGDYPLLLDTILKLSGLQLQATYGEFKGADGKYEQLEMFLPQRTIDNQQLETKRTREEWAKELADAHKMFGGNRSELESQFEYMNTVKNCPMYGFTPYVVEYRGFWSHPSKILLSIGEEGFKFLNIKTRATLAEYPYARLESVGTDAKEKTLSLNLKESSNAEEQRFFVFVTEQREDIASLIGSYSPSHRPKKEEAKPTMVAAKEVSKNDHVSALAEVEAARVKLVESGRLAKPPKAAPQQTGILGAFGGTLKKLKRSVSSNKVLETPSSSALGADGEYTKAFWSFSKAPPTQALTVLDGEASELALKSFNTLYMYQGLLTCGGFEVEGGELDFNAMLQTMIANMITHNQLCDEVFLQVIKQTTDPPPKNRHAISAWKFFCVISSVIAPRNEIILEYARAHLHRISLDANSEEGQYAAFCRKALARAAKRNDRKYPPSSEEIMYLSNRKPIQTRFFFLDGQYRALVFDSSSTAGEVVDLLKERLGLNKNTEGFAIFEVLGSLERCMLENDNVADAIFKWEKYAQSTKSSLTLRLTFKRNIYFGPYVAPSNAVEFNLNFHQAVDSVANDRFPVTLNEAVQLAALRAQVEMGDFDMGKMGQGRYKGIIDKYVPRPFRTVSTIGDSIASAHEKLRGKSEADCNVEYMSIVTKWPFYGTTIFEVQQSYTSDMPQLLWFGVGENGIHVFKPGEKEPIVSYGYEAIINYSPSVRNLMILTDSLSRGTKYVFNTSQASRIAYLIRDYAHLVYEKTQGKQGTAPPGAPPVPAPAGGERRSSLGNVNRNKRASVMPTVPVIIDEPPPPPPPPTE